MPGGGAPRRRAAAAAEAAAAAPPMAQPRHVVSGRRALWLAAAVLLAGVALQQLRQAPPPAAVGGADLPTTGWQPAGAFGAGSSGGGGTGATGSCRTASVGGGGGSGSGWAEKAGGSSGGLQAGDRVSEEGAGADEGDDGAEQRIIVRFSRYRPLPKHRAALERALRRRLPQLRWRWVERHNKASALPSDFAVIAVSLPPPPAASPAPSQGDALAELRGGLAGVRGVRDVHADRRMRGRADWRPEGRLAAAFADAGVGGSSSSSSSRAPRVRLHQEPAFGRGGSSSAHGSAAATATAAVAGAASRQLLADGNDSGPSGAPPPAPAPAPAPEPQQQQQEPDGPPPPSPAAGSSKWNVEKPPGRLTTKPTIGLDPRNPADREASGGGGGHEELRRRRRGRSLLERAASAVAARVAGAFSASTQQQQQQQPGGDGVDEQQQQQRRRRGLLGETRVTHMLEADKLWAQGFSGKGIRVGVFDTGIREGHPHIRNIKERTNWTHQDSLSDGLGHGSFVAGVIGSQDDQCPGFAPDVELYTFKVFTDDQVSYTSWFMDAFNYAIACQLHIINLSIGGPDFLDAPFVDKVQEVTSNGIVMVSAIGNDGPLYGTLNNPADMLDVLGVGGINAASQVAGFSSRGMTTWELPAGFGRMKPDVMAYGADVSGSKMQGGCRSLSGTSVASPVVAGAACLLASTLPDDKRWMLNPASMKQALVEGAVRLPNINMLEQGSGRINLPASQAVLQAYSPRASLIPSKLHLSDCPYMWPYCRQPLHAFALPVVFNATIVNGMSVIGRVEAPPTFAPSDEGGRHLHVTFEHSAVLWPWSGALAVFVEVSPAAWNFTGDASGTVTFTVVSPPPLGVKGAKEQRSTVAVPLRARIAPTPPRERRLLWDVLHSVKYPPGYVPRDNLNIKSDVLDWHGDHPFTNYHDAYNALLDAGFSVDVLAAPAACVDLRNYGAYLAFDSEEEWYREEVDALAAAVKDTGLALVVFGEWYHLESLKAMRFFDDNTRSWWTPVTGGANVPALNELLAPHGIALGERILHGVVELGPHKLTVSHGADIAKFPAGGGALHIARINDASGDGDSVPGDHAVMGVAPSGKGKVAVLGDSNCLDSSHMVGDCFALLVELLQGLLQGKATPLVGAGAGAAAPREQPYVAPGFSALAQRRDDVNFTQYSWVLQHAPMACGRTAPCRLRSAPDCPAGAPAWEHTHLTPGKEPGGGKDDAATPVRQPTAAAKPPAADAQQPPPPPPKQQEQLPPPTATDKQPAPTQQEQEQEQPVLVRVPRPGGDQHRHSALFEEVAQQGRRRAFVSQAMLLATFICVAGVVGLVVLWGVRAPVGGGPQLGPPARRNGGLRYAPVGARNGNGNGGGGGLSGTV